MNITGKSSAIVSLIFSQFALGVNWLNFAAVFPFVAKDMNQNVSALGLITAAFILGAALFQLLGGVIAARLGSKTTLLCGLLVASSAALSTGLATDLYALVILRFFVGLGAALTFAPAANLTARYFQESSGGFSFGVFTASSSFGNTAGLSVWGVLAATGGWRVSLVTGGGMVMIAALLVLISVRPDGASAIPTLSASAIKRVISEPALNVVSLMLLGPVVGSVLVSNFVVLYMETTLKVSPAVASVVGGLTPILGAASALVFGRLFDRVRRTRATLSLAGLAAALGLAAASLGNFYAVVVMVVAVGVALGVGNIAALSGARESGGGVGVYETVRFGWLNTIAMVGSFWPPIVFAYVVLTAGFPLAWLLGSIVAAGFVLPFLTRRTRMSAGNVGPGSPRAQDEPRRRSEFSSPGDNPGK